MYNVWTWSLLNNMLPCLFSFRYNLPRFIYKPHGSSNSGSTLNEDTCISLWKMIWDHGLFKRKSIPCHEPITHKTRYDENPIYSINNSTARAHDTPVWNYMYITTRFDGTRHYSVQYMIQAHFWKCMAIEFQNMVISTYWSRHTSARSINWSSLMILGLQFEYVYSHKTPEGSQWPILRKRHTFPHDASADKVW